MSVFKRSRAQNLYIFREFKCIQIFIIGILIVQLRFAFTFFGGEGGGAGACEVLDIFFDFDYLCLKLVIKVSFENKILCIKERMGALLVVPIFDQRHRIFGVLTMDSMSDMNHSIFQVHEIQFAQGIFFLSIMGIILRKITWGIKIIRYISP